MKFPVKVIRLGRYHSNRRNLPYPAKQPIRAAQITPVSFFHNVQAFPAERWQELDLFRPRILVGPANGLQHLAELVDSGTLDLGSVDHAIFVLTECGHKPLTDVLRVVLWQTFGVPIYELFMTSDGTPLAIECEAHEGWHIQPEASFSVDKDRLLLDTVAHKKIPTNLTGYIEVMPCACGRPGKRLMHIETTTPRPRQLAATA